MAAETVVSIVESAAGGAAESHFMEAVEWIRWWAAVPDRSRDEPRRAATSRDENKPDPL